MSRRCRLILLSCATAAWALALLVGLRWLWVFDATPGAPAHPAIAWPADTILDRDSSGATLVMTVHPRCACTAATIGELARVVARAPRLMRVYVLAVIPDAASCNDWQHTTLLARAGEIPGVRVVNDVGGVEARRFGAQTSGYSSLYSPDGQLLFSGGITSSRGHEGDNAGEDALIQAVSGLQPAQSQSPVFGCPLFADAAKIQVSPAQTLQARAGGAR